MQRLGMRLANDDHRRHRYTLLADRRLAVRVRLRMCGREVYAFNRAYTQRWDLLRLVYERTSKQHYEWTDNPTNLHSETQR